METPLMIGSYRVISRNLLKDGSKGTWTGTLDVKGWICVCARIGEESRAADLGKKGSSSGY